MEKRKTGERNVLWTLFTSMLYISAFTFGGGFVIVTFMKKKFVDELHWINEDEMLDMTALAQSAPGAIAVNAAILVGRRVAGFTGMIVSVLGTIIPPITILAVISLFYKAFATNPWVAAVLGGMQAGVAAVICDVVWNLGAKVVKEKERDVDCDNGGRVYRDGVFQGERDRNHTVRGGAGRNTAAR